MKGKFTHYFLILIAVGLLTFGTILGGAMTVFFDIGAAWLSAIGALVAAIGAIFAANFTRKTLIFLTKQHEDQQALQRIQMYQSHKEAFMKLLDELEQTYENQYKFTDRDRFYRSIFPTNNFNTFSTSLDLTKKSSNDDLREKIVTYDILFREVLDLKDGDYDKLNTIVYWVMKLKNSLHIVKNEKFKSGDVLRDDEMFFTNIFNVKREIHHYKYILDNLILFSGNQVAQESKTYSFPHYDLLDYCLLYNGPRGLNVHLNNEFLVKALYSLRSHLIALREKGDYTIENEGLFTKLTDLFKENSCLDEKLENKKEISSLICQSLNYLRNNAPDESTVLHINYQRIVKELTKALLELNDES